MKIKRFSPFRNEADTFQIGKMTIKNRFDRISIYGSLDITLDQEGLESARELMAILNLTILEMVHTELPDKIAAVDADIAKAPFS